MLFFIGAAFFLLFLILPETAYAWGPATHLELADAVLRHASMLPADMRHLLLSFPHDFIYGNISADIVIGKNLVEELKHCHNWKTGFKLLKKAENRSQKAFAYGYLSHLAADTVAHNRFIPEMMIRSFTARSLRHIYWEMRFDALADKKVWDMPVKLIKAVHKDNDKLLDSVIEDTPLSFGTNKTIFSSVLSLHRLKQWHRMMGLLSAASKWKLSKEVKQKYTNACVGEIMTLLNHRHAAHCTKVDPTGKESLKSAMTARKHLSSAKRQSKNIEEEIEAALKRAGV
ncbi:hypothetical protein EPN18_05190 [bacterium]|nr:MAG: hypothetical protein EPN18_05190 [bacterium]